MPDRTLPVLAACLWDLRSLCEAQVRALTDAQRHLDVVRDSDQPTKQLEATKHLQKCLKKVAESNLEIRSGVPEAAEQAEQLAATLFPRRKP